MCGIYGYLDRRNESLPGTTLDGMSACIRHRGPDDHGRFDFAGVKGLAGALANNRLSIIDLESGHQPFVSADGQIVVVQNGEIYNYIELAAELRGQGVRFETKSDTEVLLRLYEREGIGFLHRLNGMFGIAIWDGRTGEMFVARDRLGVKPIYLWEADGRTVFASEIKPLLMAGAPRRMSLEALHHYFTFLFVPPPLTLFEGIRHLEPGTYVRLSAAGTETVRWFDLASYEARTDWSLDDWTAEFRERIHHAVELRMRADVPFGAFLSGGLDSSTVVHSMAQIQKEPVQTFSIGFDDPRFDESAYSQEVADLFGTKHTIRKVDPNLVSLWPRVVWHLDQPHSDVSYMPMYKLSELAVEHVKMVLTGDGGDELFGGYNRYAEFFGREDVHHMDDAAFTQAYHDAMALATEAEKREIYSAETAQATSGLDSVTVTQRYFGESAHHDRINRALYLDTQLLLAGNNLVKPDRMPMAVSLEARDPFLDPALIELAFTTRGDFKIQEGSPRYAYKKAVEPILGPGLTHRTKTMFTVPIGEWFKTALREWSYQFLLDERTLGRGIFRPEAVRAILDDHNAERANHTRLIRSLIALELWQRTFLDQLAVMPPTLESLGAPAPAVITP